MILAAIMTNNSMMENANMGHLHKRHHQQKSELSDVTNILMRAHARNIFYDKKYQSIISANKITYKQLYINHLHNMILYNIFTKKYQQCIIEVSFHRNITASISCSHDKQTTGNE